MAYPVQEYVALVDGSGNLVGLPGTAPQGRLTLTTLVPVLTAAVATAATVFYTPYVGNFVPIYDGTVVTPTEFSELSNVLANSAVGSAGPVAGAASENYDMFVWKNGSTLTLTRGPVWTSATARSAGTTLVMVKGILLNNAAITNGPAASRGTYVGTVRTDAAGATVSWSPGGTSAGGTPATINVWNMYNRVPVAVFVRDSTASWTTNNGALHTLNSAVGSGLGNRISFVRGLDEEGVYAQLTCMVANPTSVGGGALLGVGLDTTSAATGGTLVKWASPINVAAQISLVSAYNALPGLGFHFLQAIEASSDGTVATLTGSTTESLVGVMRA